MKKKIIMTLVLAMIFSVSVCFAQTYGYDNLKFDFDYLFKWTAQKMNVQIDANKTVPVLAFASFDCLQELVEYKYNVKQKYSFFDGTITVNYEHYGFYEPKEFKIYMANNAHRLKNKPMECLIIHEIVHSIQHIYLGFDKNSREREKEADKFIDLFYQEHFQQNLKTR